MWWPEVGEKNPFVPVHIQVSELDILAKLGHEIVYLTSRPVLAIDLTRAWLAAHGFPRGSIVFLPRGHKKFFALYYSIDLVFEDDPAEVLQLQKAVGRVLVPAWPYNLNTKGRGIKAFTSWREIVGYIDCFRQLRMVL
ncbi:LNS2 domain-containing protein [Neomoorella thermoacetica]|uniref:Uncharacterized protein n=1 Tax=Moorella thermoacetica (strain ATCC 39073 / JCM 9320) TaxID=264732 RepID=Q2RI60_MOOTA|nr:hypothetical protein [Moorella thermoacetica]